MPTPDTGPGAEVPARLELGDAVVCADPGERARLGPYREYDAGPAWSAQLAAAAAAEDAERGAGIVVEDLDGDGALDIFLPNLGPCLLFWGDGEGGLLQAPPAALPTGTADCHAWGADAADLDGDGALDLFLARNGKPDAVWMGDGAGGFAPADVGLAGDACGSRGGSFGDMDGDGDLDLFVARHHVVVGGPAECETTPPAPEGYQIRAGDPSVLYENRGGGRFVDARGRLPLAHRAAWSFAGAWVDLDEDGRTELYLVHDYGRLTTPNALLRAGPRGELSDATPEGLAVSGDTMGIALGDVDGDGRLDVVLSDIDRLHLRLSAGGGAFVESARARGLEPARGRNQRASWGVELADLDHDTRLDVVAVFGPTEGPLAEGGMTAEQPDAVFLQGADGSFEDVAPAWGLDDTAAGRGLVVADLTGDGWLDLVTRDYRGGPARIHAARCGAASWLVVALEDAAPVHGARVRVRVGGRWLRRDLLPGSTSLASRGPAVLHFGLGEADSVDALEVRWPDGTRSVFADVPARRRVRVVRRGATE